MPSDTPSLAALEQAVEEAWEWLYQQDGWTTLDEAPQEALRELHRVTGKMVTARRAARDASMVACLVSRESLAALRKADVSHMGCDAEDACELLFRDLAPWLKETK